LTRGPETGDNPAVRLKLISCDVFQTEMEALLPDSRSDVELEYLPMGLHELPVRNMCARIQEAIDLTPVPPFDAIALGFGLCSGGLSGLHARTTPLIVPRAHDCISLLLGSVRRHVDCVSEHPGTCFRSCGWIDRPENSQEIQQNSIRRQMGLDFEWEELVERYGEENARYIAEQLGPDPFTRVLFIETGVEPGKRHEESARQEATQLGLTFEKTAGDLSFLRRLVEGVWDDSEFLVVPPGHSVAATWADDLVEARKTNTP